MTYLALALRILVNPLSNVFQKRLCSDGEEGRRGQSPLFVNFLTYFFLGILVVPLAWNVSWTKFPSAFWMYAALTGLFGALGNGFLVRAVRIGELSVLGPINAYKSVVGIFFGILLLGEIPNFSGLAGIVLIVAGSYVVIGRSDERSPSRIWMRPDLYYRIAALVFAAIEAVFIKKIIQYSDPDTAFVLWCWGGAIFSLTILPLQEKIDWPGELRQTGRNGPFFLGLVVSVGLMQWSTNYVLEKMSVGYALALFQLSAVLSVFYGRFFFRETRILRKLLGACVMVGGSVLIILCGNR